MYRYDRLAAGIRLVPQKVVRAFDSYHFEPGAQQSRNHCTAR